MLTKLKNSSLSLWLGGKENSNNAPWIFFFFPHTHGTWKVPGPQTEFKPQLQLSPQLQQHRVLNPLHRAGDGTCASTATQATAVRSLSPYITAGTPNTPRNLMSSNMCRKTRFVSVDASLGLLEGVGWVCSHRECHLAALFRLDLVLWPAGPR